MAPVYYAKIVVLISGLQAEILMDVQMAVIKIQDGRHYVYLEEVVPIKISIWFACCENVVLLSWKGNTHLKSARKMRMRDYGVCYSSVRGGAIAITHTIRLLCFKVQRVVDK